MTEGARRVVLRIIVITAVVGLAPIFVVRAEAHQSGCHGAHTCPSDANPPTYKCGDNANGTCNEDNAPSNAGTPQLHGPPTQADCQNHPEYYTTAVCAQFASATATPSPTQPPPATTTAPTAGPAVAGSTGANSLPNNGFNVWPFAYSSLTLLEVGGLLIALAGLGAARHRLVVASVPNWEANRAVTISSGSKRWGTAKSCRSCRETFEARAKFCGRCGALLH